MNYLSHDVFHLPQMFDLSCFKKGDDICMRPHKTPLWNSMWVSYAKCEIYLQQIKPKATEKAVSFYKYKNNQTPKPTLETKIVL